MLINQEDYENALKFHMKKGGRVYQIPGVGLDMKKFTPLSKEEREEKRKALGLGKDDFFLVSVGELNENKNQEVILKALLRLRKKNKNLNHIRYGICGDGFFWDRIREDIRKWRLQKTVTMYGYCTHVREILGCADAMAFPSRREGLGMAALEALAVGIPVIAADNRGTREYMRSGENGVVCQWNDIEGFAGAIGAPSLHESDRETTDETGMYTVCDPLPAEVYRRNYGAGVQKSGARNERKL